MSGLLALLDDVAAIAKVAAASVDDIAAASVKAGAKAAGVVIDDTAVTPRYIHGFEASRELPIIWRIAKGSLFNKLVILLPAALVLSNFAPWAIAPLLLIGGAYLCFEGAEKIWHWLLPHTDHDVDEDFDTKDPAHLEEEKARGAIKTDFVLSAEIMTIALDAIPKDALLAEAATLALVGIAITALVYGAVALIVKMDDVGLHLARTGRTGFGRRSGRGLVRAMPKLLAGLSSLGTAAMLWVGGAIVIKELAELGWGWIASRVGEAAAAAAAALPERLSPSVEWLVGALAGLVFGLALGLVLIPLASRVVGPVLAAATGRPRPH
ncbi:MAG: DUF808 domain-containing protein [Pseudomonadota bacterium]